MMFARMHTLGTTREQHDEGEKLVREEILPWLRESTGFRGMIRLATRDRSKTHLITLWADEEAARKSEQAGKKFAELTSHTTGATRVALEDFEVTFYDVESDPS